MGPDHVTVTDLGEFGLVSLVTERLAARADTGHDVVAVGPGDDAAVVRVGSGSVVVSTDVLVEGRHFRRDWAEPRLIGRRAAAATLSDLNAMGGTGTALTVGLTLPGDTPVSWVASLADGLAEEAAAVGARVVGGDLTQGDQVVVGVTGLGEVAGAPVLRSGARPGDVLAVVGRFGWAAAGLAVLARGFRSPRAVVEAYRVPEVPYGEGAAGLAAGATAMIDVSDGLLADAGHVAAASGVALDFRGEAFDVAEPLQAVGAALGVDPRTFVLTGGDDHGLLASFPAEATLPPHWRRVGEVTAGEGVRLDGAEAGPGGGFTHF